MTELSCFLSLIAIEIVQSNLIRQLTLIIAAILETPSPVICRRCDCYHLMDPNVVSLRSGTILASDNIFRPLADRDKEHLLFPSTSTVSKLAPAVTTPSSLAERVMGGFPVSIYFFNFTPRAHGAAEFS